MAGERGMPRTEFATLKEFHDYVRRMRKLYAWEGTRKYADRQRRLSPDQYEIVDMCPFPRHPAGDAVPGDDSEARMGGRAVAAGARHQARFQQGTFKLITAATSIW